MLPILTTSIKGWENVLFELIASERGLKQGWLRGGVPRWFAGTPRNRPVGICGLHTLVPFGPISNEWLFGPGLGVTRDAYTDTVP